MHVGVELDVARGGGGSSGEPQTVDALERADEPSLRRVSTTLRPAAGAFGDKAASGGSVVSDAARRVSPPNKSRVAPSGTSGGVLGPDSTSCALPADSASCAFRNAGVKKVSDARVKKCVSRGRCARPISRPTGSSLLFIALEKDVGEVDCARTNKSCTERTAYMEHGRVKRSAGRKEVPHMRPTYQLPPYVRAGLRAQDFFFGPTRLHVSTFWAGDSRWPIPPFFNRQAGGRREPGLRRANQVQ